MKPTLVAAVLVLALFVVPLTSSGFGGFASANPSEGSLQLSMPIEYINYTIGDVNGVLWAKIDGYYPISVQGECRVLPMVYPMPPNSTNIHVYLAEAELEWSNYTAAYGSGLHETALGGWRMISSTLENLSDSFVLRIHYEHPLERVNGSYLFLYDLNIVDYLSADCPDSTAYFTVCFEGNFSDVHVYTGRVGSVEGQWQPKTYTATEDGLAVEMHSQYEADLPGDLIVVFSDGTMKSENHAQDTFMPTWAVPVIIDIVFVAVLLIVKRKAVAGFFSSRKTAT